MAMVENQLDRGSAHASPLLEVTPQSSSHRKQQPTPDLLDAF